MRTTERDGGSTVQSVDRAVTILELLALHGEAGVTRLAGELGVHKSTASRLVAALERRRLVEQVQERGGYRLGVGILRLAGATNARLDLVSVARPVVRQLAAQTGETVNLAVLSGGAALYVDQVSGAANLSSYNWVGQHIPIHATSNGKVLVSELEEPERSRTLGELTGYTPATVTDPAVLADHLAQVRARGWALACDELDVGLTALAAPVRDAHGDVAASLSVSGPTFRFDQARLDQLVPMLLTAAEEASTRLAHHPSER
ncbi:IclR family transcriptional regulator [Phycicoccus endophyticus]|uniref:IclR family transcriptional regulator n=1 Tax=Phycicoccus endophyticus TaxID=1690220 RepID=A0A7G9QYV8_9MICO|nr:IclR family transcriptional regulator [Phycicoccus endophyticus]QNN48533.1 IclR family transcriptional regulator [Phycicoccus endophyticus]GGL31048.1 IclR family transcriptional regulator [Phycicoccus endophyticus]